MERRPCLLVDFPADGRGAIREVQHDDVAERALDDLGDARGERPLRTLTDKV